ncbi:MAG: hypothetical protein RJQ09_11785 [Cyclobacteriaceae bacterium]
MDKRRIIKSYEKLEPEIKKEFDDLYDDGFGEKVFRLTNARNENFFVAPIETEDAIFLVKVELKKPEDDDENEDDSYDDEDTEDRQPSKSKDDSEDSYEDDHDLD